MDIGIIGTGSMGRSLGLGWARHGHRVFLGSRDRLRGESIASHLPAGTQGGTIAEAAAFGLVTVLAVPWAGVAEAIESARDELAGKTLIDCSNPLVAAHKPLAVGHTTSGAEQIQDRAPQCRVVKAFNAIAARLIASEDHTFGPFRANVFHCGDDPQSRSTVASLIRDIDFEPVDVGELCCARYLEPLAALTLILDLASGPGVEVLLQALERRH